MGKTKDYLRFVHESTFGLVAASQVGASIKFLHMRDTQDRFVAVPANENVLFWDLKTKQVVNQLHYDSENAAEVTVIDCYHGGHPRTNLIAVGYANGHVRVFEYETGMLKADFTGHRTSISAIAFDKDGSRLASGGMDCNIVLWDIVSEKGLFSLKGHKNRVSKLAFLSNNEYQKDLIVSSSIDAVATIKFWDLQTQHCFHTIPGQADGVWSFMLLKNGTRLITGSTSPELKVYSIEFDHGVDSEISANSDKIDFTENEEAGLSQVEYGMRLKHLGNVLRNSSSISKRVQDIVTDHDETFMICHSIDKNIELYGLRNQEETLNYAKKKAKKEQRRRAKRKKGDEDNEEGENENLKEPLRSLETLEPQMLVDSEFNRKLPSQRLSGEVKALAITRITSKNGKKRYKLAVMFSSNKIESLLLEPDADADKNKELLVTNEIIENTSHRSDVRSCSISSDNSLIISASKECLKIWRLETRSCIATVETDYVTCCVFANAQNLTANFANRFVLIGTKQGSIQIVDTADARVIETIEVCKDNKQLNSICVLPDKSGIVCGGEDGIARFYSYVWGSFQEDGKRQTFLSLQEDRSLPFQEGITCVDVSANNNLLAVALLDSTVRIHFLDTFKYFLTLYGHKFPVTTMDISDDSVLLATGSPDKNIKIWGLDFGDCHKSIFAHDDAITSVKFCPKTHYIFSCGRDKTIKQWDCDHFLKIQTLRKHQGEIWCLSISPNGKFVVTGSHDKSIRLYRKTEEILVPTDEEETQRELEDERNVFEKQENIVVGETNLETGFATKMTIETVKSADRLIEAIDVFHAEREKERLYKQQCDLADQKGEPRPPEPERDPLLMTALTSDYKRFMLETFRRIRSSELEEILITLPFDYVRQLLVIISLFLDKNWETELMIRCASFLLRVNFGQIAASPTLTSIIYKLKEQMTTRAAFLKNLAGFNLIALDHLCQNKKHMKTKVDRGLSFY